MFALKAEPSRRRRAVFVAGAVLLASAGLVGAGATAAYADNIGTSWYCSVFSQTPYLTGGSPNVAKTSGYAWSCTGYAYKEYVQLHRSEGWTNPSIAQKSYGPIGLIEYPTLYPSNCDPGGAHVYFGQTFMQIDDSPGGALLSGNSGSLNPCDSL